MSWATSKLILSLISIVFLRTERFLNGDYTIFPCAWEKVGLGLLGENHRWTAGEVKWPSAWGPAQPAEGWIYSDVFWKGQLRIHHRPGTLLWLMVFCSSPGTGNRSGWPLGRWLCWAEACRWQGCWSSGAGRLAPRGRRARCRAVIQTGGKENIREALMTSDACACFISPYRTPSALGRGGDASCRW